MFGQNCNVVGSDSSGAARCATVFDADPEHDSASVIVTECKTAAAFATVALVEPDGVHKYVNGAMPVDDAVSVTLGPFAQDCREVEEDDDNYAKWKKTTTITTTNKSQALQH